MKGKKEFRKIRALLCLLLAAVLIFGTVPIEPAFASESETTEGTEELMESGGTDSDTQADEADQEEGSDSESDGEGPGSGKTEPVGETEPEPTPEPATNNESAAYTNSISGVLWIDASEDGTYDRGEQPLADYPVYLYVEGDTDNAVQTVTTDAEGKYIFEDVTPGRYVVGIKAEENGRSYLLPLKGVQKDNKFYFAPDWSKVISNPIDIAADMVVTGIDAAMRMMPQIQPMANATYTIDVTNSTTVASSISTQSLTDVSLSGNVLTFKNTVDPTDTYILTGTTTAVRIVAATGTTANITLDGASISNSSSPLELQGTAIVDLTLQAGTVNDLTSTSQAGICVPSTSTLSIDGSGTLNAKGYYGAGIGGSGLYGSENVIGGTAGQINIKNGTVAATSSYGAGIGGGGGIVAGTVGSARMNGGNGGVVTISGGIVTATGGASSAGMGGGAGSTTASNMTVAGGNGGTIHITGGTVTATGNYGNGGGGAGIGGGGSGVREVNGTALAATGHGGNITIDGGTVVATGGSNSYAGVGGAGIGGGSSARGGIAAGSGGTITINGGDITATGGVGIGGGGMYIGSIYQTGTRGAAGAGGTITINGGKVNATGLYGNNGIGGGASMGNRAVSNGGGAAGGAGTITITGGSVTATGSAATVMSSVSASGVGIGIGYGYDTSTNGTSGTVTISGGTVTATGGNTGRNGIQTVGNVFTGGSIYPTNSAGTVSVAPTPTNGSTYGAPDPVGMVIFPGYLSGDPFSIVAGGTVSSYLYKANAHPNGNVYAWLVYPGVSTDPATNVTNNSATMNGTYYMNGTTISSAYFEWGKTASYGSTKTLTTPTNVTSGNIESVSDNLTSLSSNTTYHYRLVVAVGSITVPGNDMTFTTKPVVDTLTASPTGSSTATISGTIASGSENISDVIITYAADAGFTTNVVTIDGLSGVTFTDTTYTANITGLTSGQTYYVKVEAVGPGGTSDAKTISFLAGGYPVTEKFVTLSSSYVDSTGLPDNRIYVTGSYTASGIPTSHTVGGNTYTYLGYKLDSYTTGDALTSGTPSAVAITGSRDVYYVYAIQVDLTVSKKVTGSYGDPNKAFAITITLEDNGTPVTGTYSYTGSAISGVTPPANSSIPFDASGRGTINLKHGQTITIQGLLQGHTYTVEETDGLVTGGLYAAAYSGTGTVSGSGDRISETLGTTTAAVSITNDRSTVPNGGVSGGGYRMGAVGVLTVLAAGLVMLLSFRKRRKCR